MSGPMAPPTNRQPQIMPIGMTKKPLGDDRIPQSQAIPQRNPGSIRVQAANKLGVSPGSLTDAPGLPKQTTTPRPAPVPIPAPTLPENVPLPRPRPPGLGGPPTTDSPYMKPPSPADANQSIESRLADAIAAKYGVERVPIPEPQVAQVTPSSGWRDANRPAPPSPFSASAQASPNKAVIAPQAVPAITPVPAGPPKVVDPVEARLAEAIAKRYATPAQNTPAPPQAKPTQEPASTEETQPAPAQKYTPSKGTFGGYYPRAAEEAKGKEAKVKEGKAGKKTPNFYYYDTLGVPRGDNVAAAHALTALRKKASEEPQRITPQEDRLLAASGQTEAFNLPMTPEAVAERFIQYGAGGKPSASAPKKWDAKPMNAPAGNTFQQGQRDPTVDQRDPAAMVSRSIDKATTKPIKEQAPDPVEPDDEKDD